MPASVDRTALGLPEAGVLLVSANRAQRYAQDGFWREMIAVLDRYPSTSFAALGLSDASPFLGDRQDLLSRVITPGYREDVMSYFAASDIYVDIFPSGGGSSIIEAITVGTPVVTFDQNMATPYSVNEETLAEYVAVEPLIVPHGDIETWRDVVGRLVEDEAFRGDMGRRVKEQSVNFRPDVVADNFFAALCDAFHVTLKAAA
jgi:glycosyltransferase involved in cell wall biosynthesis